MADYDIVAAFQAIEDELIASMMRNMKHHRAEETAEGIEWTMWQAEQLKALEKYKKENRKKYKKQFKDINRQIEVLLRQARAEGNMQQELEILNAIRDGFQASKVSRGMTAEFFRLNDRKLEALIEATTKDMETAETAILRMADDQYRKIIYNAQVYANTGAGTYEKAVDMATKDFLSAGLNCIVYANGARHTLADYADMAIRTASKRAYLAGEGEKRQEWGIATVIMAKRGNPCPKCLPFVGKVLIDDVWSGGRKDGVDPETGKKYPLMSYAVSKGLYHPRCKDSHTTYFPGISTADDTWTKEELEEIGLAAKQEAKQQYAERQAEKFGRLAKYSLDEENREKYQGKAKQWRSLYSNNEKSKFKENLPRYSDRILGTLNEKIGKFVEKDGTSDIIELQRKDGDYRENFKFLTEEAFNNLTIAARKKGAIILRGTKEVEEHLEKIGAAASNIGDVLLFRKNVCISEVLEEMHHFEQNLSKMNNDKGEPLRSILNEIDAKQYLLDNAKRFKIPRNEIELTEKQLRSYQKQLEEYMKGGR